MEGFIVLSGVGALSDWRYHILITLASPGLYGESDIGAFRTLIYINVIACNEYPSWVSPKCSQKTLRTNGRDGVGMT